MAEIYLTDLDTKIFAEVVEREEVNSLHTRAVIAYRNLLEAFETIADDELNIFNSHRGAALKKLADVASDDWAERFFSRPDRRAVFIRLFPKVTAIIEELKAITPADDDWIENFAQSINEDGFPSHWSSDLRQYALREGYSPGSVLRMYEHNSNFTLNQTNVAFIKGIMDTYDENNP